MSLALIQAAIERDTTPLQGENLPGSTLPEVVRSAPFVWLQFLRHLGCIYCKGLVQDIRAFLRSWEASAPPFIVFVHPNTVEEGREFFARYYPGAPAIADPEERLYRLFRVRKVNPLLELRLSTVGRLFALLRRGLWNERPTANPSLLHASFLFREGKLVWSYYAKHMSDVPEWKRFR